MIEILLYNFLKRKLDVNVYAEKNGKLPSSFVLFERIAGGEKDHIRTASFAIQSYAPALLEAAKLNEKLKKVMEEFPQEKEIGSCYLEADYNFTDTTTKHYRYQAVYNVIYYNH